MTPPGTARRDTVIAGTAPADVVAPCPTLSTTPLLLLGLCELGKPWPGTVWLTDLHVASPPALHELTQFLDRADHEFATAAPAMGFLDFTGRSYGGWHRYLTLASVAHMIDASLRHGPALT